MSKLPAVITSLDSTLATRDVIAVRRLLNEYKITAILQTRNKIFNSIGVILPCLEV